MKDDRLNGTLSILEDLLLEKDSSKDLLNKVAIIRSELQLLGFDVDYDPKKYLIQSKKHYYDEIRVVIGNLLGCRNLKIDKSDDLKMIIMDKMMNGWKYSSINVSYIRKKLNKAFPNKYNVFSKNRLLFIKLN